MRLWLANGYHYWHKKRRYSLYILKLEQGKYYIGITTFANPYRRIEQHQRGYFSSQWTKKYKPIQTLEVRSLGELTQEKAEHAETLVTQEYMEKFGHNNVRGGKFTYSGKYVSLHFGFFRDEDWKLLLTMIFFVLAFAVALLKILSLEGRLHL